MDVNELIYGYNGTYYNGSYSDTYNEDPRYFVVTGEEYNKLTNTSSGGKSVDPEQKEVTYTENGVNIIEPSGDFDGLSSVKVTVDVPSPELETKSVSITENGTTTIEPETAYGLSSVQVTVEVPTPSGGSALMLKRKSGVTLPTTLHYDQVPETGEYIEVRDREPISVLTSDIAAHAYGFRCEMVNPTEMTDHARYGVFNLPFSFDYYFDPIGYEQGNYNYFIFTGVDVPGATITVDTTYFDIVELPDGFSGDFNIGTNIDE